MFVPQCKYTLFHFKRSRFRELNIKRNQFKHLNCMIIDLIKSFYLNWESLTTNIIIIQSLEAVILLITILINYTIINIYFSIKSNIWNMYFSFGSTSIIIILCNKILLNTITNGDKLFLLFLLNRNLRLWLLPIQRFTAIHRPRWYCDQSC